MLRVLLSLISLCSLLRLIANTGGGMALGGFEVRALVRLRTHWDCLYEIRFEHGVWTAQRLDDPDAILAAPGPEELRDQLREDHAGRCVARDRRAAEGGSL
jgi:hypothetical protein